ncbi:MAG TPA: hypothetical protein VHP11_03290 [Tepidisphaeraceae bacterium]|nr:hypothetical protein [Tepidisphaeraceae bacterium]
MLTFPSSIALSPTSRHPASLRVPLLGVLIALLSTLTGCTNVITPPPPPADPVTVYLLDHGRHPSLVLPRPDGNLTRYAYGNWSWYALGKTGVFQALGALFIPGQAGLGRREFDSPSLQPILELDPAEHIYAIQVERADADRLRTQLDSLFQANISTLHPNNDYHLDFVHHPESYCFFHNSNHVAADWLRDLNCRVKGPDLLSQWRLSPVP